MQSHWEKLDTIRVVDAGYLLAGMEPARKWQFAPPIVANFFNLIRDKTGAVKLATLAGQRMEITQAEFQALKAAYGVTPTTLPIDATVVTEQAVTDAKPWLTHDPRDPDPKQRWYTPARYFARQLAIEKPTLLSNRELLADKVSTALFNAGFKKRGDKLRFDGGTVLKAFAKVTLG